MDDVERQWYDLSFDLKMLSDSAEYIAMHHPDSPLHLLIANEILRPVIESPDGEPWLWKFLRMSDPETGIHTFTFSFYGPQKLCSELIGHVYADETYRELKEQGYLELAGQEDLAIIRRGAEIKDIGDDSWPEEIRQVWPYYMHGVSRTWLKMAETCAESLRARMPHNTFDEKVNFYNHVKRLVTERWIRYGWASMLNPLNGMFGHKYIDMSLGMFSLRNINPALMPVPTSEGPMMLPGINAQIRF
jgi:hypothetical protein